MILTFTDFGRDGPYLAQLRLALRREADGIAVLDLVSDLAPFRPLEAGHLLAALCGEAPAGSVFLCVVDPGVGGPRLPVALQADGRWYLGPDNGLLDVVAARATAVRWWEIRWRPERLSASFHGRDLFAPVAARLAAGQLPAAAGCVALDRPQAADGDLAVVVYIDRYGNCMTGLRASMLPATADVRIQARVIPHARTFSAVRPGTAFWYANSCGLVEFAMNHGRAEQHLGLAVGSGFSVLPV
jgi:S-adenosylmethionine hydrolase